MTTARSDGAWVAHSPVGVDRDAAIVEGERRLMTAVLVHSLRSLVQDADRPGRIAARRLHQELGWIASADRADLFSFERICESLALDANVVRRHVLKQLEASAPLIAMRAPDRDAGGTAAFLVDLAAVAG